MLLENSDDSRPKGRKKQRERERKKGGEREGDGEENTGAVGLLVSCERAGSKRVVKGACRTLRGMMSWVFGLHTDMRLRLHSTPKLVA